MLSIQPLLAFDAILGNNPSIALVGFSPKSNRPSNMVGRYLLEAGFTVFPVNPGVSEILGHTCYPDLTAIPEKIDIIDIFRRSKDVLPIVKTAIEIQAKVIWMQQGIVNKEAATLAQKAGLTVIMDRCIKIDHQNLSR